MFYVQGFIILAGIVSLFGLKHWRPHGIVVRSVTGIIMACVVAYVLCMIDFSNNFWR